MVGRRFLEPPVEVRILLPEPQAFRGSLTVATSGSEPENVGSIPTPGSGSSLKKGLTLSGQQVSIRPCGGAWSPHRPVKAGITGSNPVWDAAA
jgi:hypothetical protein